MAEVLIPTLAAAGTASQGVSALSILAGVTTAFGALGKFQQGEFERSSFRDQAINEDQNARVEELRGKRQANALRQELLESIAANNASAGSAGIDIQSGSVRGANEASIRNANRELSVIRGDSAIRAAQLRSRARMLRDQGDAARGGRRLEGVLGLTSFFLASANRGKVPTGGRSVTPSAPGGHV